MTELKHLIRERANIKSSLTKFETFLNRVDIQEATVFELRVRLRKVEELWAKFNEIQSQIDMQAEDKTEEEKQREQFEENYYKYTGKAEELLERFSQPSNATSSGETSRKNVNVQQTGVKLPPLPNLVTFSGKYEEWMTFHDTFKAIIIEHPSLTEVQKFQYLKSALTENASKEIASLQLTAANFPVAWKILTDRYQNKQIIIERHVHSLFNLPAVERESSAALRSLVDTTQMHLRALEALKQPTAHWDTLIVYLVTTKMDKTTLREWESSLRNEDPKFEELITFINKRCKTLESLESRHMKKGDHTELKDQVNYSKRNPVPGRRVPAPSNPIRNRQMNVFVTKEENCPSCGDRHQVFSCNKFRELPVTQRIEIVKRANLCFNCLQSKHRSKDCNSSNCRVCNKKHNTLLHKDSDVNKGPCNSGPSHNASIPERQPSTEDKRHHAPNVDVHVGHSVREQNKEVLLSTVVVDIFTANGEIVQCRALLDNGSQSNFISQDLCTRLGLKQQNLDVSIRTINQHQSSIDHSTVAKIRSKHNSFQASLSCLVISTISGNLPTHKVDITKWNIPSDIALADPEFYEPSEVDLLIGSTLFWDILGNRTLKLSGSGLYLRETLFGWLVVGTVIHNCYVVCFQTYCNSTLDQKEEDLDKQLERFWQLDEPNLQPYQSEEEKKCEEHFYKSVRRNSNGRFIVKLPVKDNVTLIGSTYGQALKRLQRLEYKLSKSVEVKQNYRKFMEEYLRLNHMQLVSKKEVQKDVPEFYLPHHAVFKIDSTTTKLRVVFDGSLKSTSGVSLNDVLMVGGVVQQDLFSIILRFRTHKVVLTADIEKMYRQILVDDYDTNLQRILWRNSQEEEVQTYKLMTVTYGTSCAPYLATRCLKQLAIDEETNLPLGSKIAARDFYMDDLLTGCDNLEEAFKVQQELIELCSRGCFSLRKWRSNKAELVSHLPSDLKEPYDFDSNSAVKTLGLLWEPVGDQFSFKINIQPRLITKRSVLSDMCKVFDPLGLMGCVNIKFKIFMQQLWQLKLGWDECLPPELQGKWKQFRSQLPILENLNIPRLVIPFKEDVQLHGYSDASEAAYAACIYIRSTDKYGNVSTALLCSKSRVAPINKNKIQLPRLELCGGLLLARLVDKVLQALSHIQCNQVVLWSDSTVTLGWIKSSSAIWKTFVANRVAEIQRLTSQYIWRYVPSEDNPADLPSRGVDPGLLRNNTLWWKGPSWLARDEAYWPQLNKECRGDELERKRSRIQIMMVSLELIEKYSTLKRLLRVTAYILRFLTNLRCPAQKRLIGPLEAKELQNALFLLIKQTQEQQFTQEIKALRQGQEIHKKSKILNLHPFLDHEGILRVGGRLRHAMIDKDHKFPIILPNKHQLTDLITEKEHWENCHAGPQALLASLRTRYWPLHGGNLVRRIVHRCVRCFRCKPKNLVQQMGNLPLDRIVPSRPFTHTGVDFCGPISTKASTRRNSQAVKSYIAVFVCFSTRAIHIELVSELTTAAFLAALKRFMARRGKCSHIYSDNATNFVGSNRELRELREKFQSETMNSIIDFLSDKGVTWHFTPPRSPHFGGLWEAAVKSVKYHLKRIVGATPLTFEEAYTSLTQIEACVNSRPITPLSSDPHDLSPLTPSHFLIGEAVTTTPEPDLQSTSTGRLTRWKQVQQMIQQFWSRWSREYLSHLQARAKWTNQTDNIKVGEMVLVKDEQSIPMKWPLARVEAIHPGSDGLSRVATIRTNKGSFKRAIVKLCPLPFEANEPPNETLQALMCQQLF